jgi:hypothetical protein
MSEKAPQATFSNVSERTSRIRNAFVNGLQPRARKVTVAIV